jgi:hypothetical protein
MYNLHTVMSAPDSYKQFTADLTQAGIKLHSGFDPDHFASTDYVCRAPDDWCQAVAVAGKLLRHDPEVRLANQPLPADSYQSDYIARHALGTIINASIDPVPAADPLRSFTCRNAKGNSACGYADEAFGYTFAAMQRPERRRRDNIGHLIGWHLLTDGPTVVGVSKTNGAHTTLTLEPLTINNIPYPPGSIVNFRYSHDIKTNAKPPKLVVPVEQVAFASFVRLGAYAFKPRERGGFDPPFKPPEAAHWELDDLRQLAAGALAHSQRPLAARFRWLVSR